jgi:hypothetical protein
VDGTLENMIEIKKSDFENAYEMITECEFLSRRAILLYGVEDFSGSLQAIQHLIEWALKSLVVLIGEYTKDVWTHDPGKYLYLFRKKFEILFQDDCLKFTSLFDKTIKKLELLSSKSCAYHNKAVYGSYWNKTDGIYVPASKIITEKDVDVFWEDAGFIVGFVKLEILILGHVTEFNNDEKNRELEERLNYAKIGLHLLQNLPENLKWVEKLLESEVDLPEPNLQLYDGLKNLIRGVIDS